ncbi:MAG: SRPBCC family protein [Deltaproteobacteria bacterium]|nr:SRPBCC family protein [Deltaproteobacteria bacterium]
MPSVEHTALVNAPMEVVWKYLETMSNWAPYLEGYQKHEEISDTESIWTLKGDLGVLSRVVQIKITITEWVDFEKIAFEIEGITERVNGGGTFIPTAKSADTTELFFEFTIKAGGLIGPVANVLMKPMLKPVAANMGNSIKEEIEKSRG